MLDSPTLGAGGTLELVGGGRSLLCHLESAGVRRERVGRAVVRSVFAAARGREAIVDWYSRCVKRGRDWNWHSRRSGRSFGGVGVWLGGRAGTSSVRSVKFTSFAHHRNILHRRLSAAMVSSIVPPKVSTSAEI